MALDLYYLCINQREDYPLSIRLDSEDYTILKNKFESKGFPFKEEVLKRKVGVLYKIHIFVKGSANTLKQGIASAILEDVNIREVIADAVS